MLVKTVCTSAFQSTSILVILSITFATLSIHHLVESEDPNASSGLNRSKVENDLDLNVKAEKAGFCESRNSASSLSPTIVKDCSIDGKVDALEDQHMQSESTYTKVKEVEFKEPVESLIVETPQLLKRSQKENVILIAIVILGCLTLGSWSYINLTRSAKIMKQFPGIAAVPFLGTAWHIILQPNGFTRSFNQQFKTFGRVIRVWILHTPYVGIADAATTKKILTSPHCMDKGRVYEEIFSWILGTGLLLSKGQKWKDDRKLLNPSFKYQKFDGFLKTFNKHGKVLIDILNKEFVKSKGSNKQSQEKDIHGFIVNYTMDTISEGSLGINLSCQFNPENEFRKAATIGHSAITLRVIKPWLDFPLIWDIFGYGRLEPWVTEVATRTINKATSERIKVLKESQEAREAVTKPLIDVLLESRSQSEIYYQCINFFAGGFETTAAAINFTLFLLALNPDCQAKVHEELDDVFGSERDRDVTFADVADLKYLDMCIKESLRIFPSIPFFARLVKEDIQLDNGLVIPKGIDVIIFIYELHRDPAVFPDPERFDPERFLPEACSERSLYAYAPFSLGARNCIGQKYATLQLPTIMAHLLRNFKVTTKQTRKDIEVIYGAVTEPTQPIKLDFISRTVDE